MREFIPWYLAMVSMIEFFLLALNALITHKLIETCGVVGDRQLYTLLDKRKEK